MSEADYYYNIAKWISSRKRNNKVNCMSDKDYAEYKKTFPDAPDNKKQISDIWEEMAPIWQ